MDWLVRHRASVLLAALAVAEFTALAASGHAGRYLAAGLGAAGALVLTLRRHRPLLVSVVALALSAGSLIASPKSPSVQFFGLLVTFAVAAAVTTTRDGVVAWLAGALLLGGATARADSGNAAADFGLTLAFCTVMWVAGWLVSRHTRRADVMALRADAAEQARLVAVQVERARIARELHDVVSHGLSVVVLQTLAARSAVADNAAAELGRHLDAVESAARDALGEMRRMLGLLETGGTGGTGGAGGTGAPEPEAPSPGLRHLPALMERARAAGLDIDDSAVEPVGPRSAGFELTLYRIVQEALTNVAKHAPGAHVTVAVRSDKDGVVVRVVDDARGPADGGAPSAGAGRGLVGMRERVGLYGGTLRAAPTPRGGFAVEARLPAEDSRVPAVAS